MEVTPRILARVHSDNLHQNQIGGETDGISKDVAQDLGFMATEDVVTLMHDLDAADAAKPKPLTSAQMNANARQHVAEHLGRVNKQVIDPHYG